MSFETDTKDLNALSRREQVRDLLYQTIAVLEKYVKEKTNRMNLLIDLNKVMPALAQREWDELHRDTSDLIREIEVLSAEAKHQI